MAFETLIETSQLTRLLRDPQLRILDASAFLDLHPDKKSGYVPRSGLKEWETEHIPGAQHVDLVTAFSDTTSPLPFTMPSPKQFCTLAGNLGITDTSQVVIYSSGTMMWATRLWWMFRSVGFENCAVLNGGFDKWKAEGLSTSDQAVHYPTGAISSRPSLFGWAKKSDLIDFLKSNGNTCVIDTLSPRDYSGEHSKYGGKGHIPGSQNVFYQSLLQENQTFLPVEKLKDLFSASHALQTERVICYCGGGIASTMVAMALYLCGHRNISVYDGSMLEWARDKSLPLKTGFLP